MQYQFKTNMVCQHCIRTVTPFLNELEYVDIWHVDLEHPDKILTVEMDEDRPGSVLNAVHKAGFDAERIGEQN